MSTCYFQKNLNYGKLRCISKVQDGEKQGKQSEILNREIKYKKENDTTESEKKMLISQEMAQREVSVLLKI